MYGKAATCIGRYSKTAGARGGGGGAKPVAVLVRVSELLPPALANRLPRHDRFPFMQGVIRVFADAMGGALTSLNMGWMPIFGLLHVAFFVIHYMFASQTAHVGALYSAFCAMMLASGEAAGRVGGRGPERKGTVATRG